MLKGDVGSEDLGIILGDAKSLVGDIPGRDFGLWHLEGQGDGDATAACAYIQQTTLLAALFSLFTFNDPFTEFCCLRAWDEYAWCYMKLSPAEVSSA